MIIRTVSLLGLALATLGGAIAGNIVPINLTTSNVYMGSCFSGGCVPTVSATNVGGKFENQLFTGVDGAVPPPIASPDPQDLTTGSTTTDFDLAAQTGLTNTGDDTYLSPNSLYLNTSIVIDLGTCSGLGPTSECGLFNVSDIFTMIQGNLESFGKGDVTVTLNGVTPLGAALAPDVVILKPGTDYRSTLSTQITCDDANRTSSTSCAGATSSTAQSVGVDSNPGGTAGNSVITYNNVFGAQVKNGIDYYLDVQQIDLGSYFEGNYLDSVTITSNAPTGGTQRILFSGLSVDPSDDTPEPGTVALLGLGLASIVFGKMFTRRSDNSPV